MRILKNVLCAAALCLCVPAVADEGMWLAGFITKQLHSGMKKNGLKLKAGEIYSDEGVALCDAVVSMDFGCTGSIVSDNGLVITNHHCAYSDVFALSTPEKNYLEDGFWAMRNTEEVQIPGKHIQVLKHIYDVTGEVSELIDSLKAAGQPTGSRKLSYVMEKRYEKANPGLVAGLYIMWAGSRYFMALYKEYDDIRLVAAPPVSIAAFGGDIDNWEWPQHKGDFALYRIYENGQPLHPERKLAISSAGYREGDFAMVIGYPGITNRYMSADKLRLEKDVTLPVSNRFRKEKMDILGRWMNADPVVRLKYSDSYFMLSNVQECQESEVLCFNRFDVMGDKRDEARELQAWIRADKGRTERWGTLIEDLARTSKAVEDIERNAAWFKETLIRCSRLSILATRLNSNPENGRKSLAAEYAALDLRVEKDLVGHLLKGFYENIDSRWRGPYQSALWEECGHDSAALLETLWSSSVLTDTTRVADYIANGGPISDDPLIRFFMDIKITDFNKARDEIEGGKGMTELGREYTRALYQMRLDKGIPVYPDANSSLRLTYGTVGGYSPHDAVHCDWKSTAAGIIEKYDPTSYEYSLTDDWKSSVTGYDGYVNFLTDLDITGGNSGSPIFNARGELIGLAFDGNKESLASRVSFTENYNKCVGVDIRYVLYILRKYNPRILDELCVRNGKKNKKTTT